MVLGLAGAVGGAQWYGQRSELNASAAVAAVSGAYYEAMGVAPGQPFVEPANPETARSVREEYVVKLADVADEHDGSAAAVEARILAGNLREELGEPAAARDSFEAAVEGAPGGSELEALAQARLAESLESAGGWSEAADAWERAAEIESYPLRLEALGFAARARAAAGETERALALTDRLESEAGEATPRLPAHVRSQLDELRATR